MLPSSSVYIRFDTAIVLRCEGFELIHQQRMRIQSSWRGNKARPPYRLLLPSLRGAASTDGAHPFCERGFAPRKTVIRQEPL